TNSGHKSFVCQYRAGRRSRRLTIKGILSLDKARKQAKTVLFAVAGGSDPLEERRQVEAAAENNLKSICEEYLRREGKKLRTADWRRAVLHRLVYPKLGARQIDEIRRSEIVRLLDKIEDGHGPVMADRTLAGLRKIMKLHARRSDDFYSPIVRGMARANAKERGRQRGLTDDELGAVWKAAGGREGPFGYLARFILLTATRRSEAASMSRSELDGRDWIIPAERYKTGTEFLIPPSPAALALLDKVPRIGKGDFVFTTDGKHPISGFSKFKRDFDKACGVTGWTLHDLRRTARTIMSRAGVNKDHAERALGHTLPGVRGVYDRHEYRQEKARAFEALAG